MRCGCCWLLAPRRAASHPFFLSNFAAAGAAEDLRIDQAVVFIEDAIQVSPTRLCDTVLSPGAAVLRKAGSEPQIPAVPQFQCASAQKKCVLFCFVFFQCNCVEIAPSLPVCPAGADCAALWVDVPFL